LDIWYSAEIISATGVQEFEPRVVVAGYSNSKRNLSAVSVHCMVQKPIKGGQSIAGCSTVVNVYIYLWFQAALGT
jgi:hypothetical protein